MIFGLFGTSNSSHESTDQPFKAPHHPLGAMNPTAVANMHHEGFEPVSEPIEITDQGGKQHTVPYAFHLVPPRAMLAVACVMKKGAAYDTPGEEPNYYKVPVLDHINHALGHIYQFLAHDENEPHLTNAATRLLLAIACLYQNETKDGEQL